VVSARRRLKFEPPDTVVRAARETLAAVDAV
jgi:hypothetical protein